MTAPPVTPEKPSSSGSVVRRIVVYSVIGVLLFGMLWYTIFSAVTAALIAVGGTGVLIVGSTVSDTFESIFELLASIILGILAAIYSFFD